MSLAGPRLDRPSAIGDEGRPRAASLAVATLAVLAIVGGGGVALGSPSLLPQLGTVVGVTTAGMALLRRDGFVPLLAGAFLLALFGSILALIVLIAPLHPAGSLAVSGFAVALLGLAMTWADVGDADGFERTAATSAVIWASQLLSLLALGVVATVAILGRAVVLAAASRSGPVLSVVAFSLVLAAAAGSVLLALRWLPIRQLVPRRRRPAVEARLAAVTRTTIVIAVLAAGLCGATITLWAQGVFGLLPNASLVTGALGAFSSPLLLGPLVVVGAAALLASLGSLFLRQLARRIDAPPPRWVAASFVGAGFGVLTAIVLAIFVLVALFGVPLRPPRWTLYVGLTAFGLPVVAAFAGSALVGTTIRLLPDRAGGASLAATGLLVAAIDVADGHAALAFACVAGAVLVWDVTAFGLGLTAELGHLPETRRLELFHGVLAVGVAALAVLVAVALETVRTTALADVGGTTALFVVALGVLLLLLPLRG